MKIGVFLGYGPMVRLGSEGLGRYIGNLLKGFVSENHQVTIACAKWLIPTIEDLFSDFAIPSDSVNFIVYHKIPVLWSIYEKYILHARKTSSLKLKIAINLAELVDRFIAKILKISSITLLILLVVLCFVITIALTPVLILLFVAYLMINLFLVFKGKTAFKLRKIIERIQLFYQRFSVNDNIMYVFIENLNKQVINGLVSKINSSPKQDVWFVPALFWPQCSGIKGVKVINAPDLVTIEFPNILTDNSFITATKDCSTVIENEKYFITYCDYLRDELLANKFGKDLKQVVAIPHANNSMIEYIQIDPAENARLNTKKDFTTAFSRYVLRELWASSNICQEYLETFDFSSVRYIFYASQARPHKNLLNLIKAYEYLLRKKYLKIKLILTCNLKIYQPGYDYVLKNGLQYDIITFHGISPQNLAALYRCAELVVNPTLYEGGFPFTFGEGMSVGTPSVMSRIPQVTDVTDGYNLDDVLFDPYNWMDIAKKIEYSLNNRKSIYKREYPLYHALASRTADVVAKEYVQAFEYFIGIDKQNTQIPNRK